MNDHFPRPRRATALSFVMAVALCACGGGVDEEASSHDDHDHDHATEGAGRLAIAESGAASLRLLDLDTLTVERTHTLDNPASALYTSPGGRYVVAMQRLQDTVQFVDGGVWEEDHGDHHHGYEEDSQLLGWRLAGVRPTHYDLQAGVQAAVFMDGNATATPAQFAGVRTLTDASIASGTVVSSLDLPIAVHGLAEPVGDKLLVSARASDATDTSPTHLDFYRRNGATYTFERSLATRCNGMHGSFSSGSHTVAGCLDGVLLVTHLTATTVSDRKVTTPLRVATLAGHPRLPDQFIGIATEGVAPATVTTRFYAIDGNAATAAAHTPQGWADGRVRRAHGFGRSGQRFFVLDDQGTLISAQRQAGAWVNLARVPGAIPSMPSAAPFPAFATNGAKDEVYLTDPVAQQLVVIDSTTGAVASRRNLGHVPSAATWVGVSE